jgi:hypothetical protein
MPIIGSKGAESSGGFGQFAKTGPATYIEDVFSTYLYTGNDTGQTITNNIDLSTKGGLVWCKNRTAGNDHALFDTVRGVGKSLSSDYNGQQLIAPAGNEVSAFNTNGFTLGTDYNVYINRNTYPYASWTFRKQPKFFDVVTYTGNGAASRNISHALGSKPGFITLKRTDAAGNWFVAAWNGTTFYTGLDSSPFALNLTNGYQNPNAAAATSTTFDPNEVTISNNYGVTPSDANINGATYVAYLWATNAGGFGATGTDNVISCGSFVGDGTYRDVINLGYEPQWVITKNASGVNDWQMLDNMRGFVTSPGSNKQLQANSSNSEGSGAVGNHPTSTGFLAYDYANPGETYIYIAIRRGPMKTPTDATTVFSPNISSTVNSVNTTGFTPDAQIWAVRGGIGRNSLVVDRLRGVGTNGSTNDGSFLSTSLTDAEIGSGNNTSKSWNNTGFVTPGYAGSTPEVFWTFGRAPGFFDEVCYTGTGSATTQTHNLGVVPELMIIKSRSTLANWPVYAAPLGNNKNLLLNTTSAEASTTSLWNSTTPTTSVFSLGTGNASNQSGSTFVAYLFATLAGVSKVGSYTGNGSTQTINCGFTGGARFVLIKRTDSTGDWYVYDTARGMTTLTDPYLFLNDAAVESATLGSVTTVTTGFALNAALANININSATYIFLAIA